MVDTTSDKLILPIGSKIVVPRRTVVVAEDYEDVRQTYIDVLNNFLGELGLQIISASNKVEAIVGINAHRDDGALVMTDMRMPRDPNDGNEVAEAGLANGFQVVVVSGTSTDVKENVRARCLAVRGKPMDIDDLCNLVRRAIVLSNPAVGNGATR